MKRIFAFLVALAAASGIAFANPGNAPVAGEKLAQKDAAKAPAKAPALIDINSASAAELATLPGIGEARAKDIIKGRPYKGKDNLVERKILTEKVYDGIKDQIIAKQMAR
jgi:DNA uptake protein ComE-like DNA-binding protein